ncbi:MAG: 2Fe-2S iron-sulfur cluster-binding protein [Spirochaetaceae bacterium]
MPNVTFVYQDGNRKTIEVGEGTTIRDAAVDNNIEGIEGDCGGLAMCATCHVYVEEPFKDKIPAIERDEEEMLEATASPRTDASRLSCQIVVTSDIDGIEVLIPETQY